jgi:hypothetical protein
MNFRVYGKSISVRFLGADLALAIICAIALLAPAIAGEKRGKVIDFDDEVVEGVNKQPLDSLSQISEAARRHKKPHLYRKRGGFRTEITETLRALRYTQ